ncbi:MAG: DNA polymerase III subunit delta [Bacillota bacterium]|nr:DNA polymerase III subunit delta [Bacillota bacterium]
MAKQETVGWEEFRRDLEANRLPRVVALTGEETHLKEQALESLVRHLLGEKADDFNLSQFDGAAADQEAFFAAAFAPPLFAGRRVVVVRRCEEAPWLPLLPRYLPDLPESTTLILVSSPGGEAPAAVLQAAGPEGRRYDFPALRKRQVAPHLQAAAKRLGLAVSPGALDALQAKVGTDLTLLVNELEKIAVYLGPGAARIEAADVAAVVGRTALENSFAFVDAVLARNTSGALAVLQDLFSAGETPQAILAQLAAQFRRVVLVKALQAEGWPGVKLLKPLELGSAWAAEKVRDQARAMSLDQAEQALALILRTDYRLKRRRGLIPEVELEVLAAELCRA